MFKGKHTDDLIVYYLIVIISSYKSVKLHVDVSLDLFLLVNKISPFFPQLKQSRRLKCEACQKTKTMGSRRRDL